jgi:hypothetical protein
MKQEEKTLKIEAEVIEKKDLTLSIQQVGAVAGLIAAACGAIGALS